MITHKHGQHGWHRHSDDDYRTHQTPIENESTVLTVVKGHPAQMFDGYHTMEELYDHRRALTAALASLTGWEGGDVWRSKAHHPDDDPMFDGYFIVGMGLVSGPITYHYKLAHWNDFPTVPELEHAPKWDGATPGDTVTRLFVAVQHAAKFADTARLLAVEEASPSALA